MCVPGEASDDGAPHIFIHPVISNSTRAAGTLVHQLCHAALYSRSHGLSFRRLATAVGLVGKMTKTMEGPLFVTMMMPAIIERVGPYPHAALRQIRGLEPPKQSRMIRVTCPHCRFVMRTTWKWLKVFTPRCSNPHCPGCGEEMEVG